MIKIVNNKYYGWNGYQWVFMGYVKDKGLSDLEIYKQQ